MIKEEYEIIPLKTKKFKDGYDIQINSLLKLLKGIQKNYFYFVKMLIAENEMFAYIDAKEGLSNLIDALSKFEENDD